MRVKRQSRINEVSQNKQSLKPLLWLVIGKAIYSLLNVTSITDLVNDISPMIANRDSSMPYIVFNEEGSPENFKNSYKIVNYDLQVDIYAEKGKDQGGGKFKTIEIYEQVEEVLNRYSGTVEGIEIDTIILTRKQSLIDEQSQAARIILEYNVRVKESPSVAPQEVIHWINDDNDHIVTDNGTHLIFVK